MEKKSPDKIPPCLQTVKDELDPPPIIVFEEIVQEVDQKCVQDQMDDHEDSDGPLSTIHAEVEEEDDPDLDEDPLLASGETPEDLAKRNFAYSEDEDLEILAYLEMNGLFESRRKNSMWQKMAEEGVVPGRSWRSLKNRCNKFLIPTYFFEFEHDHEEKECPEELIGLKSPFPIRKTPIQKYSLEEDQQMLDFILENRLFGSRRGNALYKLMEDQKVVEGRTWQSMKTRFLKNIFPRMTPEDQKKHDGLAIKLMTSPVGQYFFQRKYSLEEDAKLLKYVSDHGLYSMMKGNSAWKHMERVGVLSDRTWQSMKNRFIKTLYRKMPDEDKKTFKKREPAAPFDKLRAGNYTLAEDNWILRYLLDNDKYNHVFGIKVWKDMANVGALRGRKAKSIKDRFKNIIIHKIPTGCYELTEEEMKKFPESREKFLTYI